jgi:hypothetical protein
VHQLWPALARPNFTEGTLQRHGQEEEGICDQAVPAGLALDFGGDLDHVPLAGDHFAGWGQPAGQGALPWPYQA